MVASHCADTILSDLQSTFIGRAMQKNKGRISRFLANKASIASRIDCYADSPSTKFGEALRDQVEERLSFYETGSNPTKNQSVMQKVMDQLKADEEVVVKAPGDMDVDEQPEASSSSKKEKKVCVHMRCHLFSVADHCQLLQKKRKSEAADLETVDEDGKKLKKKKSKKNLIEAEVSKRCDIIHREIGSQEVLQGEAAPATEVPAAEDSSKKVRRLESVMDIAHLLPTYQSKKKRKSEAAGADEAGDVSMTASPDKEQRKKDKKEKKKRKSEVEA